MTDTDKLICGFHENTLIVNDFDSLAPLRHRSVLHFSIINISPDSNVEFRYDNTSQIELRINVGEGSGNMFTSRDTSGHGTVKCCDGFRATGWMPHPLKKTQLTCTITPVPGQPVTLEPSSSLSFTWSEISSTAPEGFSAMTVTLSNILGVKSMVLSCPIFKKLANLDIMQFYASPSTGAAGQKIRLSWSIENADRGTLLPGGYNIIGPEPQRSSTIEITLDDRVDCYYLNLVDKNSGAFQRVNVFTMPPVISDLEIKESKVIWETHFASKVELAQDDDYETVSAMGECPLKPGTKTVSLRCSGIYSVERRLAVVSIPEINEFSLETQKHNNHMAVLLHWNTVGLSSLSIKAWDTEAYIISTDVQGMWEQVYPLQTNLVFALEYTRTSGAKDTIYL